MRPPTKTLRIFSALSLVSVSLCLQHFSLQKATAQGSTAREATAQPAQAKQKKTWNHPPQSSWKQSTWKQRTGVSKRLPPMTEAVIKPAATEILAEKTPAEKTVVNESLVEKKLVTRPLVTKPLVTKPLVTRPLATNQPNSKSSTTNSFSTRPFATKPAFSKPAASFHAAPNYVNKAAKEAEKKIQDHDLAGAVNIWSTEIDSRPENADSWIGRASVKRMIGDYRGAQDDLDRALELNANNVSALISRAAVLRRLADLRGAAKDIDRAVELAPKSYQAFAERSSLRFALNDMQGAMADYNYAITLNPELNKQVAKYAYSANSQPPLTIRDARDVSKLDGRAEAKTGAENKTAETKSSESKSADNRVGDHKTLVDNKSNEAGDTPFTSAELAHMNNSAVHEINAKHFAVAIKTFERLLEISPNYAHAKDNLVIAHNNYGLELSMRQPKEALKQFRAALYLDPRQAAIRKNLSAIMRENGQDPTSSEDRLAMANECLSQGEAEGAFVELSEALRIKNTPQLREKLQVALAAINNSDSKRANLPINQKEKLEAILETKLDSRKKSSEQELPLPTILGTILPAIPESPSTMTTIADLPNATIKSREAVALKPIRAAEDKPQTAPVQLESPSATPGYDAAFVKSTLDNPPETVLQVARQLASENRELDAEALLNRLCDILRKKSLKGDKAAEQMLELTLETLSELYFKSNRLQNAEPTLRELVAIREKTKSPDDHILGKTLAEYSLVLKSLGRGEEASKQEQKANFILNQLSAH